MLGEQIGDPLLGHVDRGRQDVARGLAGELHDVLAEIGLDRGDAVRLERLVEADLLADHALALGHRAGAGGAAQLEHDRARLGGIARPVDLAALLDHPPLEGLEIEVEMGQRMVLERLGGIAQGLELGQTIGGGAAFVLEARAGEAERRLQRAIGQRVVGIVLEGERGRLHPCLSRPGTGADRRLHRMPRQHLGDVAGLDRGAPSLEAAGDVHQAAEVGRQHQRLRRCSRSRAACRRPSWSRSPDI